MTPATLFDSGPSGFSCRPLKKEEYGYDGAGNTNSTVNFDGSGSRETIDGDNRVGQDIAYPPNGTAQTATITTTTGFDPDGNTLTRAISEQVAGSTETHAYTSTYDAADILTQEIDSGETGGVQVSQTTAYSPDADLQTRITTVTSAATKVSSTTDELDRVTAQSEAVGGTTYSRSLGYDTNSDLTGLALQTSGITVNEGLTYNNMRDWLARRLERSPLW
jgi:hypothetical protein